MVQFSSRMSQLKGSAIRELLALANKPEVLSFAGGMPAPELFPVDKIKAATDAVQKAFYAISEKLYQQANPQGGAQPGPDAGNNQQKPNDDGVVDADFKEV